MDGSEIIVDHVRLRPHEQIGLHSHSAWELSLVVTGEGVRRMGDAEEPFSSGDLILVPPELPHQWQFRQDAVDDDGLIENITILFPDSFLHRSIAYCNTLEQPLNALLGLKSSLRIMGDTADEISEMMRKAAGQSKTGQVSTLLSLLIQIAECKERKEIGRIVKKDKAEIRMTEIDIFLRCNYAREITLDRMAAHVGMNKSSFCIFFKRKAGQSFMAYVNDFRLSVARELLLNEALSVSEICYQCGFNDIHYFSRLFKQKTGVSPKKYRKDNVCRNIK